MKVIDIHHDLGELENCSSTAQPITEGISGFINPLACEHRDEGEGMFWCISVSTFLKSPCLIRHTSLIFKVSTAIRRRVSPLKVCREQSASLRQ